MDYIEFLGAVLLFRTVRDTDRIPGIWVDRWLDNIEGNKDHSPEERQYLMLATKVAELIDDRKDWLLREIEDDLREQEVPAAA